MKRGTFLFLISVFTAGIFAQEGITSLLPTGVFANITGDKREAQYKNLVVTGSETAGYVAFFAANNGTNGEELWVTDGTPAGTRMVKDINPGPGGSDINWMARFNDKVVFAADDGENGMELWISDGTEAGTYMVKDIHEYGDSNPRGFTQVNANQFVFTAMDFESETFTGDPTKKQSWLWVSDGTEEGTELIMECDARWPGISTNTYHNYWCRVGRQVFFKADYSDYRYGEELWVTDGTREGTRFIKNLNIQEFDDGGGVPSHVDNMVNFFDQKLYFGCWSLEYGHAPWASDGTTAGTYLIYDQNPGFDENGIPFSGSHSDPSKYPFKGRVFFRGFTPETGWEIAATNLEPGNHQIWDVRRYPTTEESAWADLGVEFDGVYMFCTYWGQNTDDEATNQFGGELAYYSAELDSVLLQSDFAPGILCTWQKELTVVSGSLYWWNESVDPIEIATKLTRINDKEDFPVIVTNFNPEGDRIHTLRNLDGNLLFCRLGSSPQENILYCYEYRKPGYNPEVDKEDMDRDLRYFQVGINQNKMQSKSNLVLYPNPATDKFDFYVEDKVIDLKIIDMSGRLVQTETQLSKNVNAVNVSSLRTGIYNVIVTGVKGKYVAKLVIK